VIASPAVRLTDATAERGGRTIWSHGTFAVASGSVVGVIGPNGSGKSTLLKMLLGLIVPATGTVEVLGGVPRRGDRRIGYVPQHYAGTIGEAVRCRDLVELAVTGSAFGLSKLTAEQRQRVDRAIAQVDAADFATDRLSRISGGQQQRVAIAQAIVDRPELLLLDEPLANLDLRNQQDIVDVLGSLRSPEVTMFVVAHDLNPLLSILTGAVYLLDGHAHYGDIGEVVDEELLTHLYGTDIRVIRTPQGDLFTRTA